MFTPQQREYLAVVVTSNIAGWLVYAKDVLAIFAFAVPVAYTLWKWRKEYLQDKKHDK